MTFEDWWAVIKFAFWMGVIVAIGFGVHSCTHSESWQASEQRAEARREADRQPHVIREVDGCKVYAFYEGSWHYFTRCPTTTTTERSYTVPCGAKNTQQCPKTETIVTENTP